MSVYLTRKGGLRLTLRVGADLTRVVFKGGVFLTEDPALEAAIEAHPDFGRGITKEEPRPLTPHEKSGLARTGMKLERTDLTPLAEALEASDAKEDGATVKEGSGKKGTKGKKS